jgi:hypothetical protein
MLLHIFVILILPTAQISIDQLFCSSNIYWKLAVICVSREHFGNFLNRLETSYNVSQTAITEITKELLAVTNGMHSQTVRIVAQSLGM